MILEELKALLRRLALEKVPRVEELVDSFMRSGLSYEVLGNGWCGEHIYMFRGGRGAKKLLLIGFVDPDEPIGALALQVLATHVFNLEPSLLDKYTWYIIPIADPCGAKLNENWFRNPYNLKLYILERFKLKVVDWKLPGSCNSYVFDEPTPEALAVKRAVDKAVPDLVAPLHNNDFSGLYFFLSKSIPGLIRDLKSFAYELGIPVHRGEPEASYLKVFEEGFYHEPTLCDEYRRCVEYSPDPEACIEGLGETVYGYARSVNSRVFSIVCETPYIYSRVLEDTSPSGNRLRDLYLDMIGSVAPIASYVKSVVEKILPHVDKRCPYLWEAEEYIAGWSTRLEALKRRVVMDRRYEREASRAEEFDILVVKGLWNPLLRLGVALRLLSRCEVDTPSTDTGELLEVFEKLYAELQRYPIEYLPLEKQVVMQLYTVLLAAKYLY